jgi:EmrB/QacA subfamily drug resistance transporter
MLALVLVCQLMVVLDAQIVNIALPNMKTSLHFSSESLSWVINAYTLAFGGLLLLGARAGDLLGRRPVFLWGIGLFTLASLLGGLALNSGELLGARAFQGVGAALASPTALAVLVAAYPGAKERGRAIAAFSAVSIGASAIGLIAGGMLTQWASWRWVMLINVPIGVVLVIVSYVTLPRTARLRGRFDLVGAITSTIGVTGLVYGFVNAASRGWSDTRTVVSFVIGLTMLASFIVVESKVESPITPLRLFADRNRATVYACRLLLLGAMMAQFFFLTQFLTEVLGYSELKTGFAFLPMAAAIFLMSQLTVRILVVRFNTKYVMLTGMILTTASIFWLTQLNEHSGYVSVLGSTLLFGFANSMAFVPMTTYALHNVAPEDAGAASGMVNVMQQVGGSLGLAILVTVFGSASSKAAKHAASGLSPDAVAKHAFVSGATAAFWGSAIVLTCAVVLAAIAIKSDKALELVDPLESELQVDQELSEV